MTQPAFRAAFLQIGRYGSAIVLVLLGVMLRHALSDFFGDKAAYITFYPAVMVVATFAGFWPGVLTTAMSLVATDYWVLLPVGHFLGKSFSDVVSLGVFACMGVFMSLVAGLYRTSRDKVRKGLEAAVEKERDFSSTILATAGALVVVLDGQGRIVRFNRASEQLTGYPFDEAKDRVFSDLFLMPEEIDKVEAIFLELCKGQSPQEYESYLVTRNHGLRVIRWSDTAICAPDGSVEYVIGTGIDFTEQRRAEEALQKAHDKLELAVDERTRELRQAYDKLKEETKERELAEAQLRQAQKLEALGTLAGGIAHDFNNILAAIIGFTELIHDHAPEGSREKHHAARVLQAGIRGRELVKQMLTFSRKTEEQKKPLRLSSIVKETIKFLRPSMPSTISIRVVVKSESGLILADPVQIEQILMNLATNAAHAMREKGGTLEVELGDFNVSPSGSNPHGLKPGTYMRLAVRDTGIGIPREALDRVFDPFFTTKGVGEGTGLGLSVVLGIVKQAHGHITVDSEPGKGSTFTICFPMVAEGAATEPIIDLEPPTGSERILFVDDEELLMEMGEELLAELGYEVVCRTDSREALSLVRDDPSRFDLVITDQTMPDMTGFELAREILSIRPDMPIILATGFSSVVNDESARQSGIKAFVIKPLTKAEIAGTIRKVLHG